MKQFLLLVILLQLCIICTAQDKLYVALNGDDINPGTATKPLRSLEVALNKVASAKGKTVTIFLRKGRYSLEHTIQITPALLNNHFFANSSL